MLKKIMSAATALLVTGTAVSAGGLSDQIVEAVVEPVVGVEEASDSGLGWIIPLVIVGALIAVASSGSSDGKRRLTKDLK